MAPGCFGYVRKSFSLLCLPRALSDFTARGASAAMLDGPGREREGKRREEERREGQKSRGGQALGGGRAKSQEHYIISGAESKREGYESVY